MRRRCNKVAGTIVAILLGFSMAGCASGNAGSDVSVTSSQEMRSGAAQSESSQADEKDKNGMEENESMSENPMTETGSEDAGKSEVNAKDVSSMIDALAAKYGNIDKIQLAAAVITANRDYVEKDVMEELLNSYGLSEEGLTDQFKAFVEASETAVHSTALYYKSQGGDEEAYNNFVKLVEFAISEDDKKIAEKFDKILSANASVHYGSRDGDVMLKQFEGKGSFETVCQWCLYRVIYESHPELP